MKTAIVIGSGAGGAMAAKELQGKYEVTILESGREFKPFAFDTTKLGAFRKTGLFFDERMIQLLFPSMKISQSDDKVVLVRGIGTGGTTTLATGNGLRYDGMLKELGINLDQEFDELEQELPLTRDHENNWSDATLQLFNTFKELNLDPQIMPKLLRNERCIRCGKCALGCKYGAKWDSRELITQALAKGAKILTDCHVEELVVVDNEVRAVRVQNHGKRETLKADLFILAAGGLGTPVVLENSGIHCEPHLFVDPVLCVSAPRKDVQLDKQLPMPFAAQRDGFIISPYFDHLSFFFNKQWRMPSGDIMSLMIKLADENQGEVHPQKVKKSLTSKDHDRLAVAVRECKDILVAMGIDEEEIFLGTINAGHPGGTLPLTQDQAQTLHDDRLPSNLYVADASLFPQSLGNPPMLTIMALAKRIARICSG